MQATIADLDIPEVKPALELYRGVRRQKVSPQFTHAELVARLLGLLRLWARGRGRAGSEWRFYFLERDRARSSSLVPDVSYVSFARLPYEALGEAEQPTIAPDLAIEILSPDDRRKHVAEKVELYRTYGTPIVVVVDPRAHTAAVYRLGVDRPEMYSGSDRVPVIDDFAIDLSELFAPLDPPRER
jgi:Uma2 family endonuclease